MSFEASNNSCIQWLDKRSHIRLKIHQPDVPRFVADKMAREVIEGEADVSFFTVHLDVEVSDISVNNISLVFSEH